MLTPTEIAKMTLAEANNTAKSAFKQKRFTEAKLLYEHALSLVGKNNLPALALINYHLGLCYQQLFQYQQASKFFLIASNIYSVFFFNMLSNFTHASPAEQSKSVKVMTKYDLAAAKALRFAGECIKSMSKLEGVPELLNNAALLYRIDLTDEMQTIAESVALNRNAERLTKELDVIETPLTDKLVREAEEYLAKEPDNISFRLNYGIKLFAAKDYARAQQNVERIFAILLRDDNKLYPTTQQEYEDCSRSIMSMMYGDDHTNTTHLSFFKYFYEPTLFILARNKNYPELIAIFEAAYAYYEKSADPILENEDFKKYLSLKHSLQSFESMRTQLAPIHLGSNAASATSPSERAQTANQTGKELFKKEKYAEAIPYFTQAIEFFQDDKTSANWATSHYNLARCQQMLNQHSSALSTLLLAASSITDQYATSLAGPLLKIDAILSCMQDYPPEVVLNMVNIIGNNLKLQRKIFTDVPDEIATADFNILRKDVRAQNILTFWMNENSSVELLENVAKFTCALLVSLRELGHLEMAMQIIDTVLSITDWNSESTAAQESITKINKEKASIQKSWGFDSPAPEPQKAPSAPEDATTILNHRLRRWIPSTTEQQKRAIATLKTHFKSASQLVIDAGLSAAAAPVASKAAPS